MFHLRNKFLVLQQYYYVAIVNFKFSFSYVFPSSSFIHYNCKNSFHTSLKVSNINAWGKACKTGKLLCFKDVNISRA
jgi:hypothetical protein